MSLIQIAVITPFEGIGERVAMGLSAFAKKHPDIRLNLFPLIQGAHTIEVPDEAQDGAIVVDIRDTLPALELSSTLPCVSILGQASPSAPCLIGVDHSEIGRMAAQHLNGRGYRQYAFVGGIDHDHAKQRYLAFREQLSSSELNLHLFSESFPAGGTIRPSDPSTRRYRERFSLWLESLPKPIGLFAVDDWMAYETHLACRKLGLRIPNDVAIIGVNDDDISCQMATPRLTSIRLPWERIGMEAGKLLLDRIEGMNQATSRVLSPVGLVARESTNAFAVKDKVVEQALRYMQKESIRPIRVEEVLNHVGVSRSLLERRFRGEIGRTPLVELRRQRVERARGLLADTELAINRISELCGFASNIRFTTVFREQVGITPTEFRSQMQLSE